MTKYNITEVKKEKKAQYRQMISPELMESFKDGILRLVVLEKKYKDKDYSAVKLANDLGTNSRYISAVVNTQFHMNYNEFVNRYRIDEAMTILVDRRYQKSTMEEVAQMVGFANRQSFYASFFRFQGCTPRDYKMKKLSLMNSASK